MGRAALKENPMDDLDLVVDEAIRAAGGDMRAAILGLIRGQHAIQAEAAASVSAGYVRRGLRRSPPVS